MQPTADQRSSEVKILCMSTVAFAACFAVWTIFSIIGNGIKGELGLNETEFGLLIATPILTGSLIRMPRTVRPTEPPMVLVASKRVEGAAGKRSIPAIATILDRLWLCRLCQDPEGQRNLSRDHRERLSPIVRGDSATIYK